MVLFRSLLLAMMLPLFSPVVDAQPVSTGDAISLRPNAGGDPDEVTVRLGLVDIVEIDDRGQVFIVDIYVEIDCRDRRLAVSDVEGGELRTFSLDEIWTPRLLVVNDRGLDAQLPGVATVDGAGNVTLRQRFSGPLAVDLDLRNFPFDTQRLPIDVVSYQYSPSELVFSGQSELVGRLDQLSGDGWRYSALAPEASVFRLRDGGRGGSRLTFAISAERQPGYYVLTLALPMTLILFLGWMVHWLPVDIVPARMAAASASVFSLIAFGVSFRLTLPKVAYLTDADRFVLYSTLLVLVSLAITVIATRWSADGRQDAAVRLTRLARRSFPAVYLLILALTYAA